MLSKALTFAFIDFLFNIFILFVALLYIQMQATKEAEGNITSKAEFIATLEWDQNSPSDIDLWMENPKGDIVYYHNKDAGLMTLDRDDLGIGANIITSTDGRRIQDPNRREQGSIRGIIPGTYAVNLMSFQLNQNPTTAHVVVVKLNPYQVVFDRQIVFTTNKTMVTAGTFTIDQTGTVIASDTMADVKMIGAQK